VPTTPKSYLAVSQFIFECEVSNISNFIFLSLFSAQRAESLRVFFLEYPGAYHSLEVPDTVFGASTTTQRVPDGAASTLLRLSKYHSLVYCVWLNIFFFSLPLCCGSAPARIPVADTPVPAMIL
jgi:hypothetical protein